MWTQFIVITFIKQNAEEEQISLEVNMTSNQSALQYREYQR